MKIKVLLFSICLAIFCSGCKSEEPLIVSPYDQIDTISDVWIEAEQETISPLGIKIIFHNTSERDDLFTGLWFCVEENKDETWYSLPLPAETVGFPSVDIDIPTASEIAFGFTDGIHYHSNSEISWKRSPPNEMVFQWEDIYGELPAGNYRLIICLSSKKDIPLSETSPKYYLSAPFSIS